MYDPVEEIKREFGEENELYIKAMRYADALFISLCIPSEAGSPNSPILDNEEFDQLRRQWAYHNAKQNEAVDPTPKAFKHTPLSVAISIISITASVLKELPGEDSRVQEFFEKTTRTPKYAAEWEGAAEAAGEIVRALNDAIS